MNNKLIRLFFLTLIALGAYAGSAMAQMAGGYSDAGKDSAEVRRVARIAVRSRSMRSHRKISLVSIEKAETQVVAGVNHRVCMRVRDGKRVRTVTAVVFQNLKNWYSLTDWKAGGCQEL